MASADSFHTRSTLSVAGQDVHYYRLSALQAHGFADIARLPFSLKILLENLLRHEDGRFVKKADIEVLARWDVKSTAAREISFAPARVLLQDFTGVPCVVDLAAMRDGIVRLGGDPTRVNPLQPVELVIDHSVQVDFFGQANAFQLNAELEFSRNKERYAFLRWGQNAFRNFRVVPPDTGIVHQVNLEYLARVVCTDTGADGAVAYPDTLVGTDSHTTMVNGLGVVGWGVGGIEAEAAMLGQPISMLIPSVLGFRLTGTMREGTTATDLVLTITERLRKHGVVGKFVEFFGAGLQHLTIADRATLGNMCPEYGATIAIFPIDAMTLDYLRLTGREASRVELVEAYAKAQGLFLSSGDAEPIYSETIELDLNTIEPSLAGPRRPQDRVALKNAKSGFNTTLPTLLSSAKKGASAGSAPAAASATAVADLPAVGQLEHGSVVIAAITSCTNTSNPSVMIAAGLVAKKAVEQGLERQPWVKTSLAPGSKVVTEYLRKANLDTYLDRLGFNLVGYGCTTCIGNSGPLPDDVSAEVEERNLVVASVLSGNRNFEGRIQQQVRANYLASPPLVVAYALAGRMTIDLTTEPLGYGKGGAPVYLRDLWPSEREIQETMLKSVTADMFREQYADVFGGDDRWKSLDVPTGDRFVWEPDSTYVRNPPFFDGVTLKPAPLTDIAAARALAVLGDSITTDHISPAGSIKKDSPAGKYLIEHGVQPADFNSYGARRGNHEVMMRGTFANVRLRNQLAPGTEGGWTTYQPAGDVMSIYDAAMKYKDAHVPLIILAGKEYGSGSSRDWAAKGTLLLGVRAVIAESFERIHRSNLVNMGVLPLQFDAGVNAATLGLTGRELFELTGIAQGLRSMGRVHVRAAADKTIEFDALVRIDTPEELVAFSHGGILPYVLRQLVAKKAEAMGEPGRPLTAADIKQQARALGFDACGIAPAGDHPELKFFKDWLARGYAGNMGYLPRSARRRADVRRVMPSAQCVIATATVYNTKRPYSIECADPGRAHIARYAWGDDYHEVIGRRLEQLLAWMRAASDVPFEARVYVDTGPVQERVYAQHAGIGWIGKNTCLIHPELGSWTFLAEILCSLPLETDVPSFDQCGTCTLCLEACPTHALVSPGVLDSTRCISYLTIEHRGAVPEDLHEAIGSHVYGCDICQEVCPWNAAPPVSGDPAWQPRAVWDAPRVAELAAMSDDELQQGLAGSAMERTRLTGLRRNVAIAAAQINPHSSPD